MLPETTSEIELSKGQSLIIQSDAFSKITKLNKVRISGNRHVIAQNHAFNNVTGHNSLIEITKCDRVGLESHSFKNTRGPMSLSLSECGYVTISPHAFSLLKEINIVDVQELELSSNSFQFHFSQQNGPATKVMLFDNNFLLKH